LPHRQKLAAASDSTSRGSYLDLLDGSISELARNLQSHAISSAEVTRALLDRIARTDGALGAYVTVCAERALDQAAAADERLSRGEGGPLCGVPIALKDIIETEGIPTSCGTPSRRNWLPERNAAVVKRLTAAGAVLMGKLATYEFAISSHPDIRRPANPWGNDYWAGGSSNGSAVAVAARLCFAAIGTDTGGSIRVPAALCGVTGLKPTHGRVTTRGVVPLAKTFDTVGPLARSAADATLVFEAMCTSKRVEDFRQYRIGVDRRCLADVDSTIGTALEDVIQTFARSGMQILEIDMPDTSAASIAWRVIMSVQAAHGHSNISSAQEHEFGTDLIEVIHAGRAVNGVAYCEAERTRRRFIRRLASILRTVDAIILPVVPRTDITELSLENTVLREEIFGTVLRLNASINMGGNPSLALPCGFSDSGLPIGFQIVGRLFGDEILLALGECYQSTTKWHLRLTSV